MSHAGTFAFGDLGSGRFGLALAPFEESGETHGLAAVFAQGALAARVEDGTRVGVAEVDPGQAWHVSFSSDGAGFELDFTALADPVALAGGDDQLCRVTGTVTADGATEPIACLGQRGGGSGEPAPGALLRWLGAWLGEDEAILARAERPAASDEPDAETLGVYLLEGEPPVAVAVADPRLSTQYDADGRHRRAGLELWVSEEDDYARRAAGEVVCATTFALGAARLDCAFLHWRTHGREGAGVYDVLRPA